MRFTRLLAVLTVLSPLVLVASGCKTKKSDTVVGSCDNPSSAATPGHRCSDEYLPSSKKTCAGGGGTWSDKPCSMTGAVAACRSTYSDYWYYSDSERTPQDVAAICGTQPMILPAGGAFVPKTPAQLRADRTPAALAQSGAKAAANLATIAAVTRKLPPPTGKVDLTGIKAGPGPNAAGVLLVHAEDLADLEHPKKLPYRLVGTNQLGVCSRIVNKRRTSDDDPDELHGCAERVVLAVIEVTAFAEATSAGQSSEGKTTTQWVNRGHVTGAVHFFRLDGGGKAIGGYSFSAQNDPVLPSSTLDSMRVELGERYIRALGAIEDAQPTLRLSFDLVK